MVAGATLPSQFDLIDTFDETLGFYRVLDRRSQSQMLLLRIGDSDLFTDAVKEFCQNWIRQNSRSGVPGIWSPKRLVLTRQSGAFVAFDNLAAVSLEQAIRNLGRFNAFELVQAMTRVAEVVDVFHKRLISYGHLSLRTVLVTDENACLLPDLRLPRELMLRLGTPAKEQVSIQNDRLDFAAVLHEIFCSDVNVGMSCIQLAENTKQQFGNILARWRGLSTGACRACLIELQELICKATVGKGPLRWQMVVEFMDDDSNAPSPVVELRMELPQIKSEGGAASAAIQANTPMPGMVAKEQQATPSQRVIPKRLNGRDLAAPPGLQPSLATATVSTTPVIAKNKGPSNRIIGTVFLFSTLVLAGVVGLKFFGPLASPRSSSHTPPLVIYPPAQLQEQADKLLEAEENARNNFKLDQIAPETWRKARLESENAMQFLQLNSSTDFMDGATRAIDLFNKAESIAAEYQAYTVLLQTPPILKDDDQSVPPMIRQQEPVEYKNAFQLLRDSAESAKNERFGEAEQKLREARDRIDTIEPQARLKAAYAASTSAEKITLLVPLLDRPDASPEVLAVVSDALEKNPRLWVTEAQRRIGMLGPAELVVAASELARAGHALKDDSLLNQGLVQAIEGVDSLPDSSADPQAATAAIHLLDVVAEYGSDIQKTLATNKVAKWAEVNLTEPLDIAMVAGYCYRLRNLSAWERLTNGSFSKITATDAVGDVVAVNFVVANSGSGTFSGVNLLTGIAENTPVAAALAAMFASNAGTPQANDLIQRAEQIVPALDGTNESISRSHEILAALQVANGKQIHVTDFLPSTRLTGFAASMECRQAVLDGKFDDALKLWDALPQFCLLKTDATTAIVQAGAQGLLEPAEVVRWAMSRPSGFDKAVACLAAGYTSSTEPMDSASPQFTPLKLQPNSVLVWNEHMWSGKASRSSIAFGGLAGGANSSGSLRSNPVHKMRFFIRSVDDENISGFLERTPGKEMYYCTGSYDGGTLNCQAELIIPLNTPSIPAKTHFCAVLGERMGIAVQVAIEGGSVQPALAGLDISKNVDQPTPGEQQALEELETRLLVSQMANGIGSGDQPSPVVKWTVGPTIVIQGGTRDQKILAMESLKQLGDKKIDCPFARFVFRDKLEKNDTHGLILIFDKSEKHESNAEALGLPWSSSSPMGFWIVPTERNQINAALLQIDPARFAEDQLQIALQHLWIRSFGYNIRRNEVLPLAIESTFTTLNGLPNGRLKPLSPADHKAIRIFLEDVASGMDPQKVRWELFMRKRDLWPFP